MCLYVLKIKSKCFLITILFLDSTMNDSNEKTTQNERSEEVQTIIELMPTSWVKWFALGITCLMGIILALGFLIKYSDTVDGEISITGTQAPVRLVANNNGRIILLANNKQELQQGDVIAYITNGADYRHVLCVDSLLQNIYAQKLAEYPLPDSIILGEISSAYSSFYLAYMQYRRIMESDIYALMRNNLEQKIAVDNEVMNLLKQEIFLHERIAKDAILRLKKDSLLYVANGISQKEYEERRNNCLTMEEALLSMKSTYLSKLSDANQSEMEIQRITLEETENKEKAVAELAAQRNALTNAIGVWKERYLAFSPISGELEYLGFWRDNSFVQAGQELFIVIPNRDDVTGEVMIPSFGAGKVKTGQTANIKMNNYPYEEYGMLRGKVKSLSRLTNKLETPNGTIDAYLVNISFPDGLVTNFGKTLPLDFEAKGRVEIITQPKRLIERLFDNLKSKGEK